MTTPTCRDCGTPLRKLTAMRCPHHARLALARARVSATRARWTQAAHEPCAICGGAITRRHDEAYASWMRRRACSVECGHALKRRTRAAEIVRCATCGIPLSDPRTGVCASDADNRWCWMRSQTGAVAV